MRRMPTSRQPAVRRRSADREPALQRAREALRDNAHLQDCPIDCEYQRGTLTLSGRVPNFYLKQVAQTAVRQIPGVEKVVNGIEVVPGSDQPGRGDAAPLDRSQ